MWNENWESDYALAHSAKNSKWGYSNGKRNGGRIAGQKKGSSEYQKELAYNSKKNGFGSSSSSPSNKYKGQRQGSSEYQKELAYNSKKNGFGSSSSSPSNKYKGQRQGSSEYQKELAYNSKKNVYPGGNHMPNRSDPVYESNMQKVRNQTASKNLGRNDKPYPSSYKSKALKKKSNELKNQYSNPTVIKKKDISDKVAVKMSEYRATHKSTKIKTVSTKLLSKGKNFIDKYIIGKEGVAYTNNK